MGSGDRAGGQEAAWRNPFREVAARILQDGGGWVSIYPLPFSEDEPSLHPGQSGDAPGRGNRHR
jgi:hypothetical protein